MTLWEKLDAYAASQAFPFWDFYGADAWASNVIANSSCMALNLKQDQ